MTKEELDLLETLTSWRPHPGQREFMLCNSKIKVAACGRRWGKTQAAAHEAAAIAVARPGCVQTIIAPTYDQSKIIFDAAESVFIEAKKRIRVTRTPYPKLTAGKSVITARSADGTGFGLRGRSADRIVIDEASYVRDDVITDVISPMLADRDGTLVMLGTPNGRNEFYNCFARGQTPSPEITSFRYPSVSNPHISGEYIERQRGRMTPARFAAEYEAVFGDSEDAVFPISDIEKAELRPHSLPTDAPMVAGIDWARRGDYTAICVARTDGETLEVVFEERFNHLPWSEQVERVSAVLGEYNVIYAAADATGVGDPLLEYLRQSSPTVEIEGFTFTAQSKPALIDSLALSLSKGTVSIPEGGQTASELADYKSERTRSGNLTTNAAAGSHDDTVIALALSLRASKSVPRSSSVGAIGGRKYKYI